MNTYIYKKNNEGFYDLFQKNKEDKILKILSTVFFRSPFIDLKSAYDFLINIPKDINAMGTEQFSFEIYAEDKILITDENYQWGDDYLKKHDYEFIIQRKELINLMKQAFDLILNNSEEIILSKLNNKITINGKFPFGPCSRIPYLMYRNLFGDRLFMTNTYINNTFFKILSRIFNQCLKNNDDCILLQKFLESGKTNSNINLYSVKISFIDKVMLLLKEEFDPIDYPKNQIEINLVAFYNLIKSWNEIRKTNVTEIVISQNEDSSFKLAVSYEPIKEFPKYRCYP